MISVTDLFEFFRRSAAGVMALRFAGFPAVGVNRGNIKQSGLDSLCEKKVNALSEVLELI